MTWQRPAPALTPADYVAAKRPARVLVTKTSGRKITLDHPLVAGDSLVAGEFSEEFPRTQQVVVAGVTPSAIAILKADATGYRQVRITTGDGQSVLVDDPVFIADSVIGTQSLPPRRHRVGVPLEDIKAIEVRAVNASLTTLAALAGGVAIVFTAAGIAFMAEIN